MTGHVRTDDVAIELCREIEHVVRDPDLLGDTAGIFYVRHRAAPGVRIASPELHGGPYNFVAVAHHKGRRDR